MDPLPKTINFKPKQDAVKQEVDHNEDMICSALRAIASLNRLRFSYFFIGPFYLVSSYLLCCFLSISNFSGSLTPYYCPLF